MDKNKHMNIHLSEITYKNKKYILAQNFYIDRYEGKTTFRATAYDECGNKCIVVWNPTYAYELACLLASEESHSHPDTNLMADIKAEMDANNYPYSIEEENACEWDKPYKVMGAN
ncbi:hypothetical protein X792_04915 [Dehalococcoides mccartyi CG1]|jgi:hypothetical protein|uniref:hypothetical protein n=1 Tax=Dehalococcoides mccartyi TaxID=61435 RepID=UPI0004E0A05F|nr:hypothetical protein [Dehalococcoides mccartyi]AII58714.1 hypothetical protein X792_04915 [Dehalococcoides mccartyi CG1]